MTKAASDPTADVLASFVELAQRYHRAVLAGAEPRITDAHVDRVNGEYRRLKAAGLATRLAELLDSQDPGVRYLAAVHVLGFDPARGEAVLTEMAERPPGPTALLAYASLVQWRAGALNLL